MSFYKHAFQLNGQWNFLHLPEKPNGFAVLIIGDTGHYVNKETSLWEESPHRRTLLNKLLNEGYTVFYSNLYGHHWGNPDSQALAKELIHDVLTREILNSKVHVLAEGMGALTALNLMENDSDQIRSSALINPCLDLQTYLQNAKEMKWFYKRLIFEISNAYRVPVTEVSKIVKRQKSLKEYKAKVSVKIWHSTARSVYPFSVHSRPYAQNREKLGSPITLLIHFPDRQFYYQDAIYEFFKENENQL